MHALLHTAARFFRAVLNRILVVAVLCLAVIALITSPVTTTTTSHANGTNAATATAQARRLRTFLIGDSIIFEECPHLPYYNCQGAYYGGWVSDQNGTNLVDGFVTKVNPQPGDTVFLSNISAWLTPGVDNNVVLQRLQDIYDRFVTLEVKLVVVIAPAPNFPLCTEPLTDYRLQFIGSREHQEVACGTQELIRQAEAAWPVPHIVMSPSGPYMPDGVHLTPEGQEILATQIQDFVANGATD